MTQPPKAAPTLLALDFDGVLCDGMAEYFETAWRAYCRIWKPADPTLPQALRGSFARLRPMVETGWEMPLVLRSLILGIPEDQAAADWSGTVQRLVTEEALVPAHLGAAVDDCRDEWIADQLESWLKLQRFYPGVCDRLTQLLNSPIDVFIVSTKEGRFIRQLLQDSGVDFPADRVIGKEIKQPKSQTLRDLKHQFSQGDQPLHIWFVEDRLKTLHAIQAQPDLADVQLFLANWGYNTGGDRQSVRKDAGIRLLSLNQFVQPLPQWLL